MECSVLTDFNPKDVKIKKGFNDLHPKIFNMIINKFDYELSDNEEDIDFGCLSFLAAYQRLWII